MAAGNDIWLPGITTVVALLHHGSLMGLSTLFHRPALTPGRVRLAYGIAVATDVLQFALGPLGWVVADQALDLAAAIAMWRTLGFHPLLLPTFALEFLPVADMLPTWTGCVALVIALRKRQGTVGDAPFPPGQVPGEVIEGKVSKVE